MPGRDRDDQIAMSDRRRARRHDQAAIRGAREGHDGALDLAGIAHVDRAHLHSDRRRHGLDCAELPAPAGCAGSRRTATRVTGGAISLSNSSHFPLMPYSNMNEPGGVAAGPRQALDETAPTGSVTCEHDRHGAGRLQQGRHGCGARGQDDVRRERDQFRRVFTHAVGIASAPAIIDPNIAAVDPAQLLQASANAAIRTRPSGSSAVNGSQHTNAPHPLGLLRARGERPRSRRAAEQRDELASLHVRSQAQETAS